MAAGKFVGAFGHHGDAAWGMFGWIFIYYERLSGYQLAGKYIYERNYEKSRSFAYI